MATIGSSGIEIFPINFGGNVFGWTADEPTSHSILDAFLERGGNFIDTADSYSRWVPGNRGGESETIIGSWLAARGHRDDVVIATKVFSHPDFQGLSPDNVARACDASLSRLQTDRIDLYYAHHSDPQVPVEQTAAAFDRLVRQGKVRAVGVSNHSPELVGRWLQHARAEGLAEPVAVQPGWSLVLRHDYETGLAPLVREQGLACFPYYSLASGFLTGKYRTPADAEGVARSNGVSKYLDSDGFRVVSALTEVADAHGCAPATVALAWLLAKGATAPIVSASRPGQLDDLMAAPTLALTADQLAALDDASAPFRSDGDPRRGR